jgi:hypothetical protein
MSDSFKRLLKIAVLRGTMCLLHHWRFRFDIDKYYWIKIELFCSMRWTAIACNYLFRLPALPGWWRNCRMSKVLQAHDYLRFDVRTAIFRHDILCLERVYYVWPRRFRQDARQNTVWHNNNRNLNCVCSHNKLGLKLHSSAGVALVP